MKKASITEAKNNLSALIDGLKGGSAVLIVDRGRPVARLEPVTADLDAAEGATIAARPRGHRTGAPWRAAPNAVQPTAAPRQGGASALEALLEERREGR